MVLWFCGRSQVRAQVCLLRREGLVWVDINWMDNGECLDLIEKVRTALLRPRPHHYIFKYRGDKLNRSNLFWPRPWAVGGA